MRQPPLVTGIIEQVLDDGRFKVKSSTGPNVVVKAVSKILPTKLKPGTVVALNQRTYAIVELLSDPEAVVYSADHAWAGIQYELNIIEVHGWDEITSNLQAYFVVRLKSLDQLKKVARLYRIPALFTNGEE